MHGIVIASSAEGRQSTKERHCFGRGADRKAKMLTDELGHDWETSAKIELECY